MPSITCQICGGALSADAAGRFRCTSCGVLYEKEAVQAMLRQQENPWSYAVQEGRVTILEYLGSDPAPRIPPQIEEVPVTALGKGAFYNKKFLLRLDLPEGVETIGAMAFCQCVRLEAVGLPASLRHIDRDAFTQCHSLTAAEVPPSVEELGTAVFSGCTSMRALSLPQGLRELPMLALCDCRSLTELTLPPHLETIQDSALCNCASLSALDLPDGLRRIGSMAFWGCAGLRELTIPPSVETIGAMAFGPPDGSGPLLRVQMGSQAAQWAERNHCNYRVI
jgi:hypothetical protein